MSPTTPDADTIRHACAQLRRHALVAFPTETVYGLGADARSPIAVRRIFATKGRPVDHPVIVHLQDSRQVPEWAELPDPDLFRGLAERFWPGPLTIVLPRRDTVPDEVTGGLPTVGLRVPSHPVAQALLKAYGGGLAAPSANRFGRVSPTTAAHVRDELGDGVYILDGGPTTVGVESTIVDLSGARPTLLRPGGLPREALEALLGPLEVGNTPAPGTLAAHYAPLAGVFISRQPAADAERFRQQGRRVRVLAAGPPDEHARRLYRELRRADADGIEIVVAERAEEAGLGVAINDRLQRASVGSPAPAPVTSPAQLP